MPVSICRKLYLFQIILKFMRAKCEDHILSESVIFKSLKKCGTNIWIRLPNTPCSSEYPVLNKNRVLFQKSRPLLKIPFLKKSNALPKIPCLKNPVLFRKSRVFKKWGWNGHHGVSSDTKEVTSDTMGMGVTSDTMGVTRTPWGDFGYHGGDFGHHGDIGQHGGDFRHHGGDFGHHRGDFGHISRCFRFLSTLSFNITVKSQRELSTLHLLLLHGHCFP